MKVYRIKRVTPTTGVIECLQWNGDYVVISEEMSYRECRRHIAENQYEKKSYRIAEYAGRKDAARHLLMTIYAESEIEAITCFADINLTRPKRRRELLTGDWKIIMTNYTEMR